MTTYRLGFYAFDAFDVVHADGAPEPRAADSSPQRLWRTGVRLRLAGPQRQPCFVLVEGDGAGGAITGLARGARIAPGSPFGAPAAAVRVTWKIAVRTRGGQPRVVEFGVLTIDAAEVGLIVTEPPGPETDCTVIGRLEVEPDFGLAGFVWRGPDPDDLPGPRQAASNPGFSFVVGTLIDSPAGPRPIEDLVPGDLVTTLDNGSQALRWIGRRLLRRDDLLADPGLQPIRFEAGTVGNVRPLLVAQSHRILLSDWRAQVYFGEEQVLVPAKALENGQTVCQVLPEADLIFLHLLFDRHEVILSEGALSESFHPGEAGLAALNPEEREQIAARFATPSVARRRAAFPIVRLSEAQALRLPG
jgi:hypothetical protein